MTPRSRACCATRWRGRPRRSSSSPAIARWCSARWCACSGSRRRRARPGSRSRPSEPPGVGGGVLSGRRLLTLVLAAAITVSGSARAEEGGERGSLAQLEQRSKAFYDLLERGERERAAAVWPALESDLTRYSAGLEERLGRMRDEVIERDGDLEELYKSPRWREPEINSLVAAYHLAWVRYQAA